MKTPTGVIQCHWTYRSHVDLEGLCRFNRNLQRGSLSRSIRHSLLPFGRHRSSHPAVSHDLLLSLPRSRAEGDHWLRGQATALDSERGPAWHMAVLPFTDGGAAVSVVALPCITDEAGLRAAIAEAAGGFDGGVVSALGTDRVIVRSLVPDLGSRDRAFAHYAQAAG